MLCYQTGHLFLFLLHDIIGSIGKNKGLLGQGNNSIYVLRKVGIGTILELSCAKWEFSL